MRNDDMNRFRLFCWHEQVVTCTEIKIERNEWRDFCLLKLWIDAKKSFLAFLCIQSVTHSYKYVVICQTTRNCLFLEFSFLHRSNSTKKIRFGKCDRILAFDWVCAIQDDTFWQLIDKNVFAFWWIFLCAVHFLSLCSTSSRFRPSIKHWQFETQMSCKRSQVNTKLVAFELLRILSHNSIHLILILSDAKMQIEMIRIRSINLLMTKCLV